MYTLTHHSRTTHGVLTEPSRREGKGREGKGIGGEARGETSIISSGSVTREAAPDVVGKPGDDMMLDLATIEGIDLNAEIPCGHTQHGTRHPGDEPAVLLIRWEHDCGYTSITFGICEVGWALMGVHGLRCRGCGLSRLSRDFYRIVEVLR